MDLQKVCKSLYPFSKLKQIGPILSMCMELLIRVGEICLGPFLYLSESCTIIFILCSMFSIHFASKIKHILRILEILIDYIYVHVADYKTLRWPPCLIEVSNKKKLFIINSFSEFLQEKYFSIYRRSTLNPS